MITAKAPRVNMDRSKSYQHGSCPKGLLAWRRIWSLLPEGVSELLFGGLHLALGLIAE